MEHTVYVCKVNYRSVLKIGEIRGSILVSYFEYLPRFLKLCTF